MERDREPDQNGAAMADLRMPDYDALTASTITLFDLGAGLSIARLHQISDAMVREMRAIVRQARDADVVFVPVDAAAHDDAAQPEERTLAWTLAHVVAHATATAEESAALASSLARGILPAGRSRYEEDWHKLRSTRQVLGRLEESQRLCHNFLGAWPANPHLDVFLTHDYFGAINAPAQFMLGPWHEHVHLDQLREIVRQARAARRAKSWIGRMFPAAQPVVASIQP